MAEIVGADLAAHGPQVLATLRERDPAAYARLVTDVVAFKPLLRSLASPDRPAPPIGEASSREGLADQLLEAVAADFAVHGAEAIARLRETNPTAYARLVTEAVQFKMLGPGRATRKNPLAGRRKPRQVRARDILKGECGGPIIVSSPRLPRPWLERWIAEEKALKEQGLRPEDLTPEELRSRWPKQLAAWWEQHMRQDPSFHRNRSAGL